MSGEVAAIAAGYAANAELIQRYWHIGSEVGAIEEVSSQEPGDEE